MKKIIHVDMDCFFAAIEMRDNPQLRNVPLGIGGRSEKRGVLCTANYEARKYGVRSAMPTATAFKLCPDLVLMPTNGAKIKEASEHIREIFSRYTDLIEPLSVDEAYLDVSKSESHHGSATLLAKEIKETIYKELKLTASAGVSCNKFIAKVASDWKKPDGLFTVAPKDVDVFVSDLPIERIPGVGKVTADKLKKLGFHTGRDLQQAPMQELIFRFGKFGKTLYNRSRGIDNREVETEWVRKSLSVERTFGSDKNYQQMLEYLPSLECEFTHRLERLRNKYPDQYTIKQLFVKVKFNNFKSTTSEQRLPIEFYQVLNDRCEVTPDIHEHLLELISMSYLRGNLPVRLMGIGARFLSRDNCCKGQLELFPELAS